MSITANYSAGAGHARKFFWEDKRMKILARLTVLVTIAFLLDRRVRWQRLNAPTSPLSAHKAQRIEAVRLAEPQRTRNTSRLTCKRIAALKLQIRRPSRWLILGIQPTTKGSSHPASRFR